jgi:hypothetical protein
MSELQRYIREEQFVADNGHRLRLIHYMLEERFLRLMHRLIGK